MCRNTQNSARLPPKHYTQPFDNQKRKRSFRIIAQFFSECEIFEFSEENFFHKKGGGYGKDITFLLLEPSEGGNECLLGG